MTVRTLAEAEERARLMPKLVDSILKLDGILLSECGKDDLVSIAHAHLWRKVLWDVLKKEGITREMIER